jgi:hypothetical protein
MCYIENPYHLICGHYDSMIVTHPCPAAKPTSNGILPCDNTDDLGVTNYDGPCKLCKFSCSRSPSIAGQLDMISRLRALPRPSLPPKSLMRSVSGASNDQQTALIEFCAKSKRDLEVVVSLADASCHDPGLHFDQDNPRSRFDQESAGPSPLRLLKQAKSTSESLHELKYPRKDSVTLFDGSDTTLVPDTS